MRNSRSVHEVAFRLFHDMRLQMAPRIGERGLGLTTQQMRTLRLIHAKGKVTIIDVVKTIKRDKAQISRLVDDLVKLDLISRIPNPDDGRSKILVLAQKGRVLVEHLSEIENGFSQELTKNLSTADLEVFFRVADQISDNLSDMDSGS